MFGGRVFTACSVFILVFAAATRSSPVNNNGIIIQNCDERLARLKPVFIDCHCRHITKPPLLCCDAYIASLVSKVYIVPERIGILLLTQYYIVNTKKA